MRLLALAVLSLVFSQIAFAESIDALIATDKAAIGQPATSTTTSAKQFPIPPNAENILKTGARIPQIAREKLTNATTAQRAAVANLPQARNGTRVEVPRPLAQETKGNLTQQPECAADREKVKRLETENELMKNKLRELGVKIEDILPKLNGTSAGPANATRQERKIAGQPGGTNGAAINPGNGGKPPQPIADIDCAASAIAQVADKKAVAPNDSKATANTSAAATANKAAAKATAAVDAEASPPSPPATTGREYVDANGCQHVCKNVTVCAKTVVPQCQKGTAVFSYKDSNGCTLYGCKKAVTACPTASVPTNCVSGYDLYKYELYNTTDANGCLVYGCRAKSTCPSVAKPDCASGSELVTAKDSKGCTTYACKSTCPTPVAPACAKGTTLYSYYDSSNCVVFGCKGTAVEVVPEPPKCPTPVVPSACTSGYDAYKYETYTYTDGSGCLVYGCKPKAAQTATAIANSMADTAATCTRQS